MTGKAAKGFTLIEMVVAFAILGLSLSVLYASFQGALSRSLHDSRSSEATLVARSLLARSGIEWPFSQGTVRGESHGFNYEVAVQLVSPPKSEKDYTVPYFEVTATVSWMEFAGLRTILLSTFKFDG
jgi:general secretion pathway protein I